MRSAPPLLFDDHPPPFHAPTGSPRRGVLVVLLLYFATRIVVWIAAYTGSLFEFRINFQLTRPMEKHAERLAPLVADAQTPEGREARRLFFDFAPLCRFDGEHYRSIIERGYRYKAVPIDAPQNEKEQNIAFFPLYPLLCVPLAQIFSARAAMVLVSHACSLAAVLLLFTWVRQRIDEPTGLFTVACVLCLPQACYYSFGYAESATLLTTVATLMLLDRGAFGAAAIVCGIATAARPTAAALIPVFVLAYWLHSSAPPRRRIISLTALTAVASAGIAGYALYLTVRFGSPFVYFENFRMGWVPDKHRADWFEYLTLARVWDQFKHFGRALRSLPIGLPELINPFAWNMVINFFILFLSLAGLSRVPRRFRPLLLLGPFIFLQAYLASGGATFGVQPISRYMAVSVSAFIVLAAWCQREWPVGLRCALLTFFMLLQAAWAMRFGLGEWSS